MMYRLLVFCATNLIVSVHERFGQVHPVDRHRVVQRSFALEVCKIGVGRQGSCALGFAEEAKRIGQWAGVFGSCACFDGPMPQEHLHLVPQEQQSINAHVHQLPYYRKGWMHVN